MAIQYLDESYAFSEGEIRFPSKERTTLWIEIRWMRADGEPFVLTFMFSGLSDHSADAVLGIHSFGCANDCDNEWDRRHVIGVYDGVHENLYNGEIEITRVGDLVRIKGFGFQAPSWNGWDGIKKTGGYRIEFDEMVTVKA